MDNLLFYALLAALALYFFYYLPSQKKTTRPDPFKPTTGTQSTQTDFIKSPSRSDTSLTDPELTESEPKPEYTPTPGSFPFSNQERTELEQTLDFLIKEMRDLDKSLDVPF